MQDKFEYFTNQPRPENERYETPVGILMLISQYDKITKELAAYKEVLIERNKEEEKANVAAEYYGDRKYFGTGKKRGRPKKNKQEAPDEPAKKNRGSSIYRPAGATFRVNLRSSQSNPRKQQPKSDLDYGTGREDDLDEPALLEDEPRRAPGSAVDDYQGPTGES
jgi:hypothetical protein